MKKMKYGYARVSTRKQLQGNSIEDQRNSLISAGCDEVVEEQFTGKIADRPKLDKLLEKLQPGDTFVVTKIDRFARSMIEGCELVKKLLEKNINVHILNIGYMDNSPSSKLIRNIFFAFAEYERDMIIERTQEGKAIARQKEGFKDGRPKKFSKKQLEHALSLLSVNGGSNSYKEVEEITGISISTLQRNQRKEKHMQEVTKR